jgi:DNA-directed RNA polymerase alpha subunit
MKIQLTESPVDGKNYFSQSEGVNEEKIKIILRMKNFLDQTKSMIKFTIVSGSTPPF